MKKTGRAGKKISVRGGEAGNLGNWGKKSRGKRKSK